MTSTECRGHRVYQLIVSGDSSIRIPITLLPVEREILSLASATDPETDQPIELLGYSLGRQFQRTDIPRTHSTIDTALRRLIGWGFLQYRLERVPGKTRKYYSITPAGIEKVK
ncbi:MAG TPA: hypothetical protein VMR77_01500 [Patescibacteria group bacterium]|jgi:hypothetical protein|nr:hypothetical protein [Patescibacteria group bacterium]